MDSNLPETTIVNPALKQNPPANNNKVKIFLIIGGVILLLVLTGMGAYFFVKTKQQPQPQPVPTPTPTPQIQQGAKFFLQADPVEVSVGGQIRLTAFVKSDLDAANLFIAKLKFANTLLQAKNISLRSESTSSGFIKDWFISNWVENTIDNNSGSVSLVGGVPNPGFQSPVESSGSAMADVIFEAKAPGDAIISFDDTSAVYRNSDNANILTGKQGIAIKIIAEASPSAAITPTVTLAPTITPTASPTPSGPLEGDVNQDSKVDLQDLSALLSLWGKKGSEGAKADLNSDGVVNVFDYSKLVSLLKQVQMVK
ncbi:MAG: dockerin type I domain-containing protein [Candidatus Daviesbacteria bacterium]|nr:dockerin type I domain-containing protein [Candidatus Daviesbacteria bacterium]